jgi:hypothetical protein
VEGGVLDRLIYGSILDAYGTEMFGRDVAVSEESKILMNELALLNRRALRSQLSTEDEGRMEDLRRILPTRSSDILPE